MSAARPLVLVTRARDDAAAWCEALEVAGYEARAYPCIDVEIRDDDEVRAALSGALAASAWCALTSPHAVEAVAALAAPGALEGLRLASVGPQTTRALRDRLGRDPALEASDGTGATLARELAAVLDDEAASRGVAAPGSDRARPHLEQALGTRGVPVRRVDVYRTVLPAESPSRENLAAIGAAAALLASPSAVEGLLRRAAVDESVALISIGPVTSEALRDAGLRVAAEAPEPSIEALIRALDAVLERAPPERSQEFTMSSSSESLFERAQKVIPGGVNSPVRAFRGVGGTPRVVQSAEGATLSDVDGRTYVDFMMSWGPLILGHAHEEVLHAVRTATGRGLTYGAPCRDEVELAELVVDAYPGLEQVRFVSSGTEAAMSAIRLARGATGRDLVVKFSGCYHGHVDHLLVAAGSGLATFGTPSSAGVPEPFASMTRVLPLDDEAAVRELFAKEGESIAAVAIEPVPANNGLLVQRVEFLQLLRELTREHGAKLLFDEVISGFRVARGGAAELYDVTPDLACFGKIVGGGMPVGAFGGPRELMRHLAPEGEVYQAGTLSGNPVAMAAGRATLEVLERENAWQRLETLGAYLDERVGGVLARAQAPARHVRVGSLFWLSLQDGEPPRAAECIHPDAAERYKTIFHGLLEKGVYLAPSAYEVGFLSLAHTREHVDALAEGLDGLV